MSLPLTKIIIFRKFSVLSGMENGTWRSALKNWEQVKVSGIFSGSLWPLELFNISLIGLKYIVNTLAAYF